MIPLKARLAAMISRNGPLSVAEYMAACLYDPQGGYYRGGAKLGARGDFVTAPEISQMFGELLGLWAAQSWLDLGAPAPFILAELGPGRGTLMADALRAAAKVPGFVSAAAITLIEIDPGLKRAQAAALAGAPIAWADQLAALAPGPTVLIANEYLDCLPIRQFVRDAHAWRERQIGVQGADLCFGLSDPAPPLAGMPAQAPQGALFELRPAFASIAADLAARFAAAPGRALFIDYGAPEQGFGDTLQAVRAHQKLGPLQAPGESDLTAHVDFAALATSARAAGLAVAGPIAQGDFLRALGIETRAQALVAARPDRATAIAQDLRRLTHADEMGVLFQAICLSSAHLPPPPGF